MKQPILKTTIYLILAASSLFAQDLSVRAIEAAVDDHLYTFAEEQVWRALSINRTIEEKTDMTLLLVRSLIGQKRFEDAIILCDESGHLLKNDSFIYWKAQAYLEADNIPAVFQTLDTLPRKSTFVPLGLRLTGRIEQERGNLDKAEEIYNRFRKKFATHEEAQQNLIDLITIQLEQKQTETAIQTMELLLEQFPHGDVSDSIRLLLARNLLTTNNQKDQTRAIEVFKELGDNESALPRFRIAALLDVSNLERKAGRTAAAAEALFNAETLTGETALRARQKAARANLLFDEGNTADALSLFDDAARIAPDEELAAEITIQKAEILLETEKHAPAENAFQACLNVSANPALRAQALSGKSWCLWHQGRYEESAITFEQAALKHTDPEAITIARVKAGDARLAAEQFEKAHKNYHFVTETSPDHPLAARACYQEGIALLHAEKLGEAREHFLVTETKYPDSAFASNAALQQASLLQRSKNYEPALMEYVRILKQYTNTTTQVTALHQKGLILRKLNRNDEALTAFDRVVELYPEAPEAPQAFYMRGFCRYLMGEVEQALNIFNEFINTYPESPWTPEVLFLVAELAYNNGDYPQAEIKFLDIIDRFPENELADDALYWAGNSLLKRNLYLKAFNTYTKLAEDYPHSELISRTRFAQGETLTELGEFARAILAYEEVIQTSPDEPLSDRARGRLADCLFTLKRYPEAIETYQILYKRSSKSFDMKLQALYKIGRCEEKSGQPEKAFAHYMEAAYSVGEREEPLSPETVIWFTRAALEAAAQQEKDEKWIEAIHIYERIIEANVPAKQNAENRIKEIRRKQNLEHTK